MTFIYSAVNKLFNQLPPIACCKTLDMNGLLVIH